MNPIELTARREALGLGIGALANHFGVREQSVHRWEVGSYEPKDWGWIEEGIQDLEDYQDKLVQQMIEVADAAHAADEELALVTFSTDAHYWDWDKEAGEKKIPVGFHRAATAQALRLLKTKYSEAVSISRAPRADIF